MFSEFLLEVQTEVLLKINGSDLRDHGVCVEKIKKLLLVLFDS